MTIIEAVLTVMRSADRPLTSSEVLADITTKRLYEFGAKDPLSLVRAQMRRHCVGYERKVGASIRYFEKIDRDHFRLLDHPIKIGA